MVADCNCHLPNALLTAFEAPFLQNRLLHLKGDVLQPSQEHHPFEAGIASALLNAFLVPLLPVRLRELVDELPCQGLGQLDASLQRLRRRHGLWRLFLGLGEQGPPSSLGVVIDLLIAICTEEPILKRLANHVLRALLVLRSRGSYPLSLCFAILQNTPAVWTELCHLVESGQGGLRLVEVAQALLCLDLSVPRLVVLGVDLQRAVRGL
mmetsp:Transcript_33342/g.84922  ORF Transcript_33342/g.84922 Transcript_33342/m.84922 type:complete len:209 (+) Transcript_33342:162-788(+)